MSTITKKQYLTLKARLEEERAATASALETMERHHTGHLITKADHEAWNELYDYEDTIRGKWQDLEDRWQTRHWGAADWTAHQLILQNID